jgi:WD40 repeat protein
MKFPIAILLVLLCFPTAFSQTKPVVEDKGNFGLYAVHDSILLHKYLERENRLMLVGRKNLQLLDLEDFKVIETRPIALQFADRRSEYQYIDWPISPDGRRIALLGLKEGYTKANSENKQSASILDLQTGKRIALLSHPDRILKATWSNNGKTLMTMDAAGVNIFTKTLNVSFWDGETFEHRQSITVENVTWIHLSNDGSRFFAASGKPKKLLGIKYVADSGSVVRIWKTESGELEKTIAVSDSEFHLKTREIEISPDEEFLVVANKHKSNPSRHRLLVWKINADIKPKYELQPQPKIDDSRVMFSPDGRLFALDVGKNLQIYETETGTLKAELANVELPSWGWLDNETLGSIDFTSGFVSIGKMLKAFDANNGRPLFRQKLAYEESKGMGLAEDETVVNDDTMLRRHPTRKMFLTSSDKFVKIFDSRTGELLQTVVGPQVRIDLMGKPKVIPGDMVSSAGWSKDGKALYVFSADHRSVSLWRLIE